MAGIKSIVKAKEAKNDEFYTRLEDIEAEISSHPDYVKAFQGKTVLCNCDDPEWSAFYEFFRLHFNQLGLKKLITTHYNKDGSPSYKLEWSGEKLGDDTVNMIKTPLQGDGDFRSDECVQLMLDADIIVTNPPFSLFREYVTLLIENNKKFIVLGNTNAVNYKEFFTLLKNNEVWIGYKSPSGGMWFYVTEEFQTKVLHEEVSATYKILDDGKMICNCPAMWYTNIEIDKIHDKLILTKNYYGNEDKYPHYDNYDAIDVGSLKDLPKDYDGVMGVPITFMSVYCPEQFEIIASSQTGCHPDSMVLKKYKDYKGYKADGTSNGRTGSTCGNNPMIAKNDGKHAYYMNDQGHTVQSTFGKLFIRRKKVS